MNPLRGSGKLAYGNDNYSNIIDPAFDVELKRLMHRNLIFDNIANDLWYDKFNRFGWVNLFDYEQPAREYVFITKPDLYICNGDTIATASLNKACHGSPLIREVFERKKKIIFELQYNINNSDNIKDPFMHLISNHLTSKMDIPSLSAETHKSTPNNYGAGIDYRTHSLRSDYAFDFALSVKDTPTLDIYLLTKVYDEYMRMLRLGEIIPYATTNAIDSQRSDANIKNGYERYKDYVINKIIPEQFSVYKFVVGSDGETLIYWAKATGVYFVDVPRTEFSDPPTDGFKYSLSMHANFVEDMNPMILYDFNAISPAATTTGSASDYLPVADSNGINNEPAKYARIFRVGGDNRTTRRGVTYDYRIKWTDRCRSIYSQNNYGGLGYAFTNRTNAGSGYMY